MTRPTPRGPEGPVGNQPDPSSCPDDDKPLARLARALPSITKDGNTMRPTGFCQQIIDDDTEEVCGKWLPGERKFCGYHLAMRNPR